MVKAQCKLARLNVHIQGHTIVTIALFSAAGARAHTRPPVLYTIKLSLSVTCWFHNDKFSLLEVSDNFL